MSGRDLTRFKEFKKQGIAVKFGRFTQKENKQIRKNVEEFLSLTGVDSAEKLLFTSRYPEDKDTIHHLKIKHNFYLHLGFMGIPRPWRLVYYRARKMFDPNNYKGRYTMEEKEQLKKYQALHGNDWKKISELMSRSNLSVAMKFSEIKSAINYGAWTKEETQRLMSAVKEVLRRKLNTENPSSVSSLEQSNVDLWIDREKLYQSLPWTEIETRVESRYWRQSLNYVLISACKLLLSHIHRLYETKAEDATSFSSFYGYTKDKMFKIIDYLYEKKLPELEEKLRKEEGKCHSFDNSVASQQQQIFRLSDIFDSSEESD
uniref:Myb-like domain-containing protein n=1 Tax=Cyanistes caeruleus TaxID=156563 RepID=A0A8C0U1X9_CYACU